MNDLENLKKNYIEKKDIILLDFFDTIVHRKCSPVEIKKIWAYRISQKINFFYEPEIIFKTRLEAENDLENLFEQKYDYGQLMNRIIQRLQAYSIMENVSLIPQIALKIEKEVEAEFLYLDKDILQILNFCDELGKDIYVISDYHMGADVIEYYLDYLGINKYFKNIFVSCECKRSKYSGTMYEYVLEQVSHTFEECLMIGDNKQSDIKNSNKYGIKAYYKRYVNKNNIKKNEVNKFLYREYEKKNYSGFCFSLSLFTEKLYIKLKQDNASKVFFLSREGEFLKKLFDAYLKIQNDNSIETRYLYVSRQSTFLASLNIDLDEEKFHNLFRQFKNMSAKTFMLNLDFSAEDILAVQEEVQIDINKEIKNFEQSECIKDLKNSGTFRNAYINVVEFQKTMFEKYLDQEGYRKGETLYIVDVGWKGTIQDNMSNILPNVKINGFYVGFGELGWDEVKKNNIKNGLFFSTVPYQTLMDKRLALDAGLFEKILYASHASTSRYEIENETVVPIFKYYEEEDGIYNLIKPIQKKIKEKSIRIFSFFKGHGMLMSEYSHTMEILHIKTVLKMNYDKLSLRVKVEENHFENFGLFDTVDVGNVSENFSVKKDRKYFIQRIKQVFNPEYFIRNCYHFRNVKSVIFWSVYSGIIIKRAIKDI